MQVTSNSFAAGGPIPQKFSSYGANVSPQLSWSAPPANTQTLVLLVEDPDAPGRQPFVHWLMFNIPATTSSVDEGAVPSGAMLGMNDGGRAGYYGPKPPSGTHHYHFKLFAVDQPLQLKAGSTKDDVMKAIDFHTLGRGELVGTFSH